MITVRVGRNKGTTSTFYIDSFSIRQTSIFANRGETMPTPSGKEIAWFIEAIMGRFKDEALVPLSYIEGDFFMSDFLDMFSLLLLF